MIQICGATYIQSVPSLSPVSASWLQASNGNLASAGSLVDANANENSNYPKYRISGSDSTNNFDDDYYITELVTSNGNKIYANETNTKHLFLKDNRWYLTDDWQNVDAGNVGPAYYSEDNGITWLSYIGESVLNMSMYEYVYNISGAGTSEFDGNYFDTRVTIAGQPSYMSGGKETTTSAKLLFFSSYSSCWYLNYAGFTINELKTSAENNNDDPLSYLPISTTGYYSKTDDIAGEWTYSEWTVKTPVPKITKISSIDVSDENTDVYIVSGAGITDANGTYTRSGNTSDGYPLYVKGDWQLYYQNDVIRTCTVIVNPSLYPAYVYAMQSGSDGNYAGGTWEANGSGYGSAPTVVKGGSESGGGSTDKTYLYTVSGAGTASANGDYWDTGETNYGYPICTNGTYYLYFFGGDEWWVLDDALNAPPFAYHCSVMNVAPNEGSWNVESGSSPAPTITAYAGGNTNTGRYCST